MSDSGVAVLGREPRFHGSLRERVELSVERNGDSSRLPAEIQDISLGGVKILVQAPLLFEEPLALHLETPDGEFQERIEAQVRWIRSVSENRWLAGCAIHPPMALDALENLFEAGIVERRRFERHGVAQPATVDWELGRQGLPVEIRDLSDGGFCLLVVEPGAGGSGRLRLEIDAQPDQPMRRITGVEKWRTETSEGTLVGCEFTDRHGFHVLREWLSPATTDDASAGGSGDSRRIKALFALLAAVASLYLLWLCL